MFEADNLENYAAAVMAGAKPVSVKRMEEILREQEIQFAARRQAEDDHVRNWFKRAAETPLKPEFQR